MDNVEIFPDWVPASVVEVAKELLRASFVSAEEKAIINRLITDEIMKSVWRTLRTKHRYGPRKFKYYKGPDSPEFWEGTQQRKMRDLFVAAAAGLYHGERPFIKRRELVKLRKPYLDMARNLEQTKTALHNLGIGSKAEILTIGGLIEECKLTAYNIGNGWIIIDREVDDPHLRGFLQKLVETNESLFGNQLRRTAASIASVRFNTKVTPQMVREAIGA